MNILQDVRQRQHKYKVHVVKLACEIHKSTHVQCTVKQSITNGSVTYTLQINSAVTAFEQ